MVAVCIFMRINKNYLVFGIALVLLVILLVIFSLDKNYVGIKTEDDLIKLKVEIADSDKEREVGLMNRKYLCENCGMLFIFPEGGEHKFWMKDTLIALDMIFVGTEKKIVFIEKDAKPCEFDPCEVYPKEDVRFMYVVEVNSGFSDKNKVNIGDRVLF